MYCNFLLQFFSQGGSCYKLPIHNPSKPTDHFNSVLPTLIKMYVSQLGQLTGCYASIVGKYATYW